MLLWFAKELPFQRSRFFTAWLFFVFLSNFFLLAMPSWISQEFLSSSFESTATFARTFTASSKLVSASTCQHVFPPTTAKNAREVINNDYDHQTDVVVFFVISFSSPEKKAFFPSKTCTERLFPMQRLPGMISSRAVFAWEKSFSGSFCMRKKRWALFSG